MRNAWNALTIGIVIAFGAGTFASTPDGKAPQPPPASDAKADASSPGEDAVVEVWIEQHGLPADWFDLLAVPSQLRRPVYAQLPAETASSIWQAKLTQALELPGWNPDQTDVLLDVLELATPELFATPGGCKAERDALQARAVNFFSRSELRRVFASLEVIPHNDLQANDSSGSTALRSTDGSKGEESSLRECDCNLDFPVCPFPEVCLRDPPPCDSSPAGCGFLWLLPCDGACVGAM